MIGDFDLREHLRSVERIPDPDGSVAGSRHDVEGVFAWHRMYGVQDFVGVVEREHDVTTDEIPAYDQPVGESTDQYRSFLVALHCRRCRFARHAEAQRPDAVVDLHHGRQVRVAAWIGRRAVYGDGGERAHVADRMAHARLNVGKQQHALRLGRVDHRVDAVRVVGSNSARAPVGVPGELLRIEIPHPAAGNDAVGEIHGPARSLPGADDGGRHAVHHTRRGCDGAAEPSGGQAQAVLRVPGVQDAVFAQAQCELAPAMARQGDGDYPAVVTVPLGEPSRGVETVEYLGLEVA